MGPSGPYSVVIAVNLKELFFIFYSTMVLIVTHIIYEAKVQLDKEIQLWNRSWEPRWLGGGQENGSYYLWPVKMSNA